MLPAWLILWADLTELNDTEKLVNIIPGRACEGASGRDEH